MKKFRLVLITENQNSLEKGNKMAALVCEELSLQDDYKVSKYDKLKNSYKIEIIGQIPQKKESIIEAIRMTDKVASPWIVKLNKLENEVELIFNKNDSSNFSRDEFNVINWANFEMI